MHFELIGQSSGAELVERCHCRRHSSLMKCAWPCCMIHAHLQSLKAKAQPQHPQCLQVRLWASPSGQHSALVSSTCAMTGYNRKEVQAALTLAQDISPGSVSAEPGPDGQSTIATVHAPAAGQHSKEKQQKHSVVEPFSRHAGCECSRAIQLSFCEHQLAVFLRTFVGPRTPGEVTGVVTRQGRKGVATGALTVRRKRMPAVYQGHALRRYDTASLTCIQCGTRTKSVCQCDRPICPHSNALGDAGHQVCNAWWVLSP
jgi:hypothetical protein